MSDILENLKNKSIRFQIDPIETFGHAAKLSTVSKVLNDINESYNNFLEIEFLKNKDFKKVFENTPKVFENIKNDLELLIIDLKFSSFEAALAPNLENNQTSIFVDNVRNWQTETFNSFKDNIILGDYSSISHLNSMTKRYTETERLRIFKPIFSSIGNGLTYKINIKGNDGKITKILYQPEKVSRNMYIPKLKDEEIKNVISEKNYIIYAKLKSDESNENVIFNNKSIKKIHHIEELAHDIYPYNPNIIQYNNLVFILKNKMETKVIFEENNYVIESKDLDIIVWGETREKAEDAFQFSFYSLYNNFYLELDKNLSTNAITLKEKLKTLILNVVKNEA